MDWIKLLPPSDLLDQVQGVESGLRKRKRLSQLGWLGTIVAASVQITAVLAKVGDLGAISEQLQETSVAQWAFAVCGFLLVFSLLLTTWSRYWLQESRQPFRYTCSIGSFRRVAQDPKETRRTCVDEAIEWLPHDLRKLLHQRVRRFRFVDEKTEADREPEHEHTATAGDGPEGAYNESRIHVTGRIVVRKPAWESPAAQTKDETQDAFELEVVPSVSVGGPARPAEPCVAATCASPWPAP